MYLCLPTKGEKKQSNKKKEADIKAKTNQGQYAEQKNRELAQHRTEGGGV